jgi:diadenosine tetraphosphate (Ap4A) HIT family hydrolase
VPCISCRQNSLEAELPLRERLWCRGAWRVAHGWSSLPGWLVVVARRHLVSLSELEEAEAAELGRLLRSLSAALEAELGCARTYTTLFAELEGHQHVHLHVVPRMPWFGDGERGTAVFRFLAVPEEEWVPVDERERLAARLAARLGAEA